MKDDFLITKISRIIYVGKNEYSEQVTSFPKNLNYNELIFNFSGKSIINFNQKILYDKADTIRFLPKGIAEEYTVKRIERGDCIVIYFLTDKPITSEPFVLSPLHATSLSALFKKIFSVWIGKNEGYYFECISILYKIFSELQKPTYLSNNQYATIKPAIDYINEHFLEKNISVEELSKVCTISYSYLKKLFIKKFGIPPKKYIIQMKINYACDLLKCNLYSVTQISEMCGFLDVYYFSNCFKKSMGISPKDYINKYKSSK